MKRLVCVLVLVSILSACGMQNNDIKVENVELNKDKVKVENIEINKDTTKVDDIEIKNNPETDEALKVVNEVLGE